MTTSIDQILYDEVSAADERDVMKPGKILRKRDIHKQSWLLNVYSKMSTKMVISCMLFVLITAGSIVLIISSRTSLHQKNVVFNDTGEITVLDDSNEDNEIRNSASPDTFNNTGHRYPKLRSYTRYEKRRLPDGVGHVNIYLRKSFAQPYNRLRFPVARYTRRRNPLNRGLIRFLPWRNLFADRSTRQTIIYSYTHVYIIPSLINVHNQKFAIAELILKGYASLVRSGTLLNRNIDMLRYFHPNLLIGPNIPKIDPSTGFFSDGLYTSFGVFSNTQEYQSQFNIDDSSETDDEDDHNQQEEESNYGTQYESSVRRRRPNSPEKHTMTMTSFSTTAKLATLTTTSTTTTTTTTKLKTTTTTTTTTLKTTTTTTTPTTSTTATTTTTTTAGVPTKSYEPICESNEASRTPYVMKPFQDNFVNPPVINPLSKECRTDGHCMFSYSIDVIDTNLALFNGIIPACSTKAETKFIGYAGQVPGPTIIVPVGHESIVRFNNKVGNNFPQNLPGCQGNRKGRPIGIHHHGSASAPNFDGWADDSICLDETKEYVYPNNRPASDWYHDHAVHITTDNAYYGLAGLYLVSSKKKHGGCGEPWNLEDIEEKHLILQDKALDSECQLLIEKETVDKESLYGDINMISGIPFPVMHLEPKWYRFRILNAAVSRPYLVKIKNAILEDVSQSICLVIATDGGFRRQPVVFPVDGLLVGISERYEIVCDFSGFQNQNLYLWNEKDDEYMKDVPYFCFSHLLSELKISSRIDDLAPKFDETLTTPEPERPIERVLSAADIAEAIKMAEEGNSHREMRFEKSGGQWVINGETWESFKIAADDVGQNTWELWEFKTGGGWFHPIHIHLVDFYMIARKGGGGLKQYEILSPKDTIFLGPSQRIWTIIRFGPHRGDYMFHCHNLVHEDDDMMRAFRVIESDNGLNSKTAEPFISNDLTKIIYSNWKYRNPLLPDTAPKPTRDLEPLNSAYIQNMLKINIYRIFYPNAIDDPLPDGFINPWRSSWCPIV